jgi:hypothetical protein
MGYVIAALLVVLIVSGFVFFLVSNAARKSNVSDAGDPGAESNPLAITGSDRESPAGSTSQHSDADGTEGPPQQDRPDVARPVDGGEAEARRSI